jgi:L-serine dehydratase
LNREEKSVYDFETINEWLEIAEKEKVSLAEVVIQREMDLAENSRSAVEDKMKKSLEVMREAIEQGISKKVESMSSLVGGDGKLIEEARKEGETITGDIMSQAVARALAVSEVNAAMGRIVAVPTAGSCGILPGALLTIADAKQIDDEKIVEALFVASGVGLVGAKQASVSGAEGGCQAECGTAAGMAAAAVTYVIGGNKEQLANAVAFSLKNILGLVCDPVAGLVEVPCIKRNAMGASNALISAEMALAGVESIIPADEVIVAMKKVGDALPTELKETSLGGLAATPTGCKIKNELFSEENEGGK